MRILIYGINYSPELTGIGKYTGEMATWMAEKGHEVKVVTSLPYYPEWSVHESYKGKLWMKETIHNVSVVRCPIYVPKDVTSIKRILHEFSFLASIFPVWFLTLFQKKYDVVFVISPPFHLGLLPLLYAKLRGALLVGHIQDLQVDAARDLGMIKNRSFLNVMFGLEKFILKRSTRVSTISEGMKRKIVAKGIDPNNMLMFPNWVDIDTIKPLSKAESLREEMGIEMDDQVILYSGNLGEKQGLEVIIDAARLLSNQKKTKFVICGSGGGKDKLITSAQHAKLTNVLFFPLQPYDQLSRLLAIADLHLILQKKSASDLVMPSKLTGILAAGGCAIVTASPGTSLYDVINLNKLGILVEPESVEALVNAILDTNSQDLNGYRLNARKYAINDLSRDKILESFDDTLLQLIESQ